MNREDLLADLEGSEIAVIGMAGRFPGSRNIDEYWQNLRDGVESISFLSDEVLEAAGVNPELLQNPNYVKARGVLDDMEQFDPGFFGFSPRDASIMDPQHRHFLECTWEALEHAGHDPNRFDGPIGIYGGSGYNGYMSHCLLTNPDLVRSVGFFLLRHTGNDKDFLTTRASYLMNLKGPSVNVQTACSTSLVAVHLGCQSLLNGECDMALAGGVTIEVPHRRGYMYHEGEILSPDGHCRAFDAESKGTIFGSGVGVVVLRRLEDALQDGDTIHAVIKGSAINNDGAGKVNYLAPSVDGQTAAIAEAIDMSNIEADSISYIETHGTGTRIGDPIEVAALTQAFRATTDEKGFCGIGSVKTNIGHLDTAAGVASLIKTVLALKHKQVPPSLNFNRPNPHIDFENSPFYVNASLSEWKKEETPRRAGINSLGVGGTNAFVIVEEFPELSSVESVRPWKLLLLSAKTKTALESATQNLVAHFKEEPEINLADAAYTLQTGRGQFGHRRFLVCKDVDDAVGAFESNDRKRVISQKSKETESSIVFMFPGGGAQYPNMGLELYEHEPVYRACIDECIALVKPEIRDELKGLMFPDEADVEAAGKSLQRPSLALPALMMTEYALAKLWISWGIEPAAMTGHSMGEYTAACLAGVLSLKDTLAIVTLRGELFETLPQGAMLSVSSSEEAIEPFLEEGLSIAVINGPELCVVSGEVAAIDKMEGVLEKQEIEYRRIKIDVAAHSPMLEPILDKFESYLNTITFSPPEIPYVSNVTGTWVKAEDATSPKYWVRHLRHTVRFADGLSELLKDDPDRVILEVGPGQTLSSLTRMHPDKVLSHAVQPTFPHPKEEISELQHVYTALGRVWQAGLLIDWEGHYEVEERKRIPLPTYPFEHQQYWVEPGKQLPFESKLNALKKKTDIAEWFYIPGWRKALRPDTIKALDLDTTYIIFKDGDGFSDAVVADLEQKGIPKSKLICVERGGEFASKSSSSYVINPDLPEDFNRLFEAFEEPPGRIKIIHVWNITDSASTENSTSEYVSKSCWQNIFNLTLALNTLKGNGSVDLYIITNHLFDPTETTHLASGKASILGLSQVIPHEFPRINCTVLDIDEFIEAQSFDSRAILHTVKEILEDVGDTYVAFRGHSRWVQTYESIELPASDNSKNWLREKGVYILTGGLGGIGLELGLHLARKQQIKLVLVSRSGLPDRDFWDTLLDNDDALSRKIRKIREIETTGTEVLVIAADVTDAKAVQNVVQTTRSRFGTVNGVIHAAGTIDDNLMLIKSPEEFEGVLAPKMKGASNLGRALADEPLDFFVLFSSVSSILGLPGQSDYASANAHLDIYAQKATYDTPETRTLAINWSAWNEVGMAAGMVLDNTCHSESVELNHPMLQRYHVNKDESRLFNATFEEQSDWYLDGHRNIKGEAILPGTAYLEIGCAVWQKEKGFEPVELSDFVFLSPLRVAERSEVKTLLKTQENGYHELAVQSKSSDKSWIDHARGRVRSVPNAKGISRDIEEIESRCHLLVKELGNQEPVTNQEKYIFWGPRWKNVSKVMVGEREGIAHLTLPDAFVGDLDLYYLHPALMDTATGFGLLLLDDYEAADVFYVPMSYEKITVLKPLPQIISVHTKCANPTEKEYVRLDIELLDEMGNVVVKVDGFTMKRVNPDVLVVFDEEQVESGKMIEEGQSHIEAPDKLAVDLALGLSTEEGLEVFDRIMASGLRSQVIVSPVDFSNWVREVDQNARKTYEETLLSENSTDVLTKQVRPNLSEDYEAPRNETEEIIATIWENVLGITSIGVHDNFFELGGHSLILVRIASHIRSKTKQNLSVKMLFDNPTIASLAINLKQDETKDDFDKPDMVIMSRERFRTSKDSFKVKVLDESE